MSTPTVVSIGSVDELWALLALGATRTESAEGGERVDQLAHGLQCANELALAAPDDVELQVAGLVHDIGHLLVPGDDAGHGRHGRVAIDSLLGSRVGRLVELHVAAKRYLVTTDPAYRDILSTVSTTTLRNQGGFMSASDIVEFRTDPHAAAAITLRRADDAAKVPGRLVPGLDHWRPVVDQLVAASR